MYERLLVAVDHSEVSPRVIAAARDLASLSKGKVWVLHIREREFGRLGLTPSEPDQEAQEAVRDGSRPSSRPELTPRERCGRRSTGTRRASAGP